MSELTLLVLRLGFLLLLWLFIFGIVYALRSDLFGRRVRKMNPDAAAAPVASPEPLYSAAPAPSAPLPPFVAPTPAGAALTEPVGAHSPRSASPSPASSGHSVKATTQNASRLVITSGPKVGTEFPLTAESITIGRSTDSSLVIRDDYTSTHHARLMLWNGEWMIQDLDSTNGTFLSGARVVVPTPVPLNAPVKIGATTFELRR
ncbi:FHA domain-containing protein FhaB/FipA [Leifsonia kafniensis]|uniref:FHA domain-containing protein FhaB/FipA n=1 Tax=Leifsonia kafniensis TaxID=475957 RepID=UPI0031EAE601